MQGFLVLEQVVYGAGPKLALKEQSNCMQW